MARAAEVLCERQAILWNALRTLRIHQWTKNVLLIVPLLLAHEFTDIERLLKAALAFVAFSLATSVVYILNDLVDLQSYRRHPYKRRDRWPLVWCGRVVVWFLAERGQLQGDPVVFALAERGSYVVGALVGSLLVLASML